jgi:hypothetical protein
MLPSNSHATAGVRTCYAFQMSYLAPDVSGSQGPWELKARALIKDRWGWAAGNQNPTSRATRGAYLLLLPARIGSGNCFQFPVPEGFSLSDGGAGALMPAPLATSFSLLWRCT